VIVISWNKITLENKNKKTSNNNIYISTLVVQHNLNKNLTVKTSFFSSSLMLKNTTQTSHREKRLRERGRGWVGECLSVFQDEDD